MHINVDNYIYVYVSTHKIQEILKNLKTCLNPKHGIDFFMVLFNFLNSEQSIII